MQCFCLLHRIERAEENDNKAWYILMLVFSIVFYIGSAVAIILLYVFFTEVRPSFLLEAEHSYSTFLNLRGRFSPCVY